ncbi:chorismate-binding protein, partial [Chitinophagales bacterium]|nr:chorismate-binding protein [Chitinophagales bacterium]
AKTEGIKREERPSRNTSKSDFLFSVNESQRLIYEQNCPKVVVSRIKNCSSNKTPGRVFEDLVNHYPQAFRYLFYHPSAGLWLAATPELLFQYDNGILSTAALAGTKDINATDSWGNKELEEHRYVSDFIRGRLKELKPSQFNERGPFTVAAGPVCHLKTLFKAEVRSAINWEAFTSGLHPTPAISGSPMKKAQQIIKQVEEHDRSYYCGYIGPISNSTNEVNLFVNLRCLNWQSASAIQLYLGCGITAQSDAEQEWEETELKAQTLQRFL